MLEGALGTAVRWFFLVSGVIMLALTIWSAYLAITRRDTSRRSAAGKSAVVGALWACGALAIAIQPPSEILDQILGPSLFLALGLQLLWFPEILGPRFPIAKRGLAFFFIGNGPLFLLPLLVPAVYIVNATLIWEVLVVLVCVVLALVASNRVQRLRQIQR